MSVEVDRATVPCAVCGAQVQELRRGRCWDCYRQWAELRPVGRGAACAVCHERRREHLRLIEVHTRTLSLCFLCAARTLRLEDVPPTLEGLRNRLQRERRGVERRGDALDSRIFPRERRVGDRRDQPRAARSGDTDPAFKLPEFDDLVIEIDEADIEEMETTQVRARPTRSNP
jgi:hypothetical protein